MTDQETIGVIIFPMGRGEQENFVYMDAARQAMIFFGGKMWFVLTYICSLAIITANSCGAMIVEKLKRKLGCRKADKQQQRNAEAIWGNQFQHNV